MLLGLFWFLVVAVNPWHSLLYWHHCNLCLCLLTGSPGYRFLLIDTLLDEDPPSSTTSPHLNLTTSTKILFPNTLTSTEDIFRVQCEGTFWRNTVQPTTPSEAFHVNNSYLVSVLRPQRYQQQYLQHYNTTKQQYLLSTKCYFTRIFLLILKYSVKWEL